MNSDSRIFFLLTFFVVPIALVIGGCGPSPRIDTRVCPPETQITSRAVLAHSVEGRQIEYMRIGCGEKTTLVIGGIHGNEPASEIIAWELADRLKQNPNILKGHSVIIVPASNPDGLAAGTRENARGVDLNRNFPAENRENIPLYGMEGFSEPESRALQELKEIYPPSRIISIHQPLECIDYDGPGREIAEAMAKYCDLPVKKLGARPGSYGSYAGIELGIPIITYEMRRYDEQYSPEELWDMYGKSLMAGIYYPEPPVLP